MLNSELFSQVQGVQKQILLVTKYWDKKITSRILHEALDDFGDVVYGIGENRVENIIKKDLPREYMHFIGNVQSRKIPEIVQHCSCIHSLTSFKHAQKIENQNLKISAFIQIRLDENKNIGIGEEELEEFLKACKSFQNLKIIGISGMGSGDSHEIEKRNEFQKLIHLRNTYIPNGLISAGTSRDYKIALQQGIDIVRIGKSLRTK